MAQDVQRYQGVREEVPIISEVRSFLKQVKRGPPRITESLALYAVGDGCSDPTFPSATTVQVHVGCDRLLHQVD